MVDVVRKIDKMRVDRNWTIYKLSNEANISSQTFHQWLNGDTTPSLPALSNICEVLGITLSELFAEGDLIEVTPEVRELYYNWKCLTKEEQLSVKQIVDNYIRSKRK